MGRLHCISRRWPVIASQPATAQHAKQPLSQPWQNFLHDQCLITTDYFVGKLFINPKETSSYGIILYLETTKVSNPLSFEYKHPRKVYSGTSHNRLSEIRTASVQLQRTNNVPPQVDFTIEIIHFNLREMDNLLSGQKVNLPSKDKQPYKIASKSGQRSKPWVYRKQISIKISTDS